MELRHLPLTIRATADADDDVGLVEAYTSVFDTEYVVDEYGSREVVRSGAFADSIEERDTVPVFYQHGHADGHAPIGVAEPTEDDEGLLTRAEIWLDNPAGKSVYRALRSGALREWSIGFAATDTGEDGDLTEVLGADLREVSVVLLGANPDTDTLSVRWAKDVDKPVKDLGPLPLHRWL